MRSKKNKKKLLIAITLGMVATMGVFSMINAQKAQVEELNKRLAQQNASLSNGPSGPAPLAQQAVEMSNAILVKTDIKAGEVITINKIEKKEYKKSELPPNSFPNENYVIGKTASQDIFAGKIITSEDIFASTQNTLNIPEGMRAITIPTSAIQGLASYVYVGSKIDLISVKSPPEFIAQNVKIIALETEQNTQAGTSASPQTAVSTPPAQPAQTTPPGQPVASATPVSSTNTTTIGSSVSAGKDNISANKAAGITILVPTITARKVIDAMIAGKLQVLTRGSSDDKIVKVRNTYSTSNSHINPITAGSILPPPPAGTGKLPSLPGVVSNNPSPPTPAAPEKPKIEVEVIEASNKRQVTFGDSSGSSVNRQATVPVNNSLNNSSNELKDLRNLLKVSN